MAASGAIPQRLCFIVGIASLLWRNSALHVKVINPLQIYNVTLAIHLKRISAAHSLTK
jgi:hypothetical protein